jgi:HEAT repeat protein
MRQYLQELVGRICTVENVANSVDSVSWKALREAGGQTDLSMVPELVDFLYTNPGKEQRQAAYFIVGKLGRNRQDSDCASVLLSFIPKEKDKYALAGLLDRLAEIEKPAAMDLNPIYQLLTDKRWLVRHSAIQALNNTNTPAVEEHLLAVMATSTDATDLIYCHATLNRVGSKKSIPGLQEGLKSRKRDVKHSAKAAIEAILSRSAAQQGVPADAEKRRG